ncbi:hypothetical protein RFM68_33105 [Mesorhizobium sp. MSK_1335]|uniref:Uncharacterized protein n=1 Tax=Mesorhizobium montanum TaxID=3072323 RepID=A0ABU4ZZ35_9HYPH|nr:hypothetical protein [Mesorhizobium sp. MSK_1335]MDX8529273.1 hypothetical protein [Mesorhizobium sp. MSK_1335]
MQIDEHIRIAQRHVRDGERQIARQHDRIDRLRCKSLPTADALKFLGLLEEIHALQQQYLSRLLSKSTGSMAGAELSAAKAQVAQRGNELILIPDPVVRLALELEKELNEIKLAWSTAKPPKSRLH